MIEKVKKITIRFTKEEHTEITNKAKTSKLSLSSYIRKLVFGKKIVLQDALTQEEKWELSKLRQQEKNIFKELSAQGKNLNQVAKVISSMNKEIQQGNKSIFGKFFSKNNQQFHEFSVLIKEAIKANKILTEQSKNNIKS